MARGQQWLVEMPPFCFLPTSKARKLVLVEPIHEKDSVKLRWHVAKVMAAVGDGELRSDEHSAYRDIVPEDRHRLCLTTGVRARSSGPVICMVRLWPRIVLWRLKV